MKKLLIAIGVISILVSCSSTVSEANKESRFTAYDNYLTVTTDKETGCKYIVIYNKSIDGIGAGITPLMLPDGTQDCN